MCLRLALHQDFLPPRRCSGRAHAPRRRRDPQPRDGGPAGLALHRGRGLGRDPARGAQRRREGRRVTVVTHTIHTSAIVLRLTIKACV